MLTERPHQAAAGGWSSADAVDSLCLTTRLPKLRDTFSPSRPSVVESGREGNKGRSFKISSLLHAHMRIKAFIVAGVSRGSFFLRSW